MYGEDGSYDALLHLAGEVPHLSESVRVRTCFGCSNVRRDAVLVLAISGGFGDCSGCGEIPMTFLLALFSTLVCRLWRLGVRALSFSPQVSEVRSWNHRSGDCPHIPVQKSVSDIVLSCGDQKRTQVEKQHYQERMPTFHTLNSIAARSECQHPSVLDKFTQIGHGNKSCDDQRHDTFDDHEVKVMVSDGQEETYQDQHQKDRKALPRFHAEILSCA